jgi:ATP-dependent Lon protease
VLAKRNAPHLRERVIAEIAEIVPDMLATTAWSASNDPHLGLALAAGLDRLATVEDNADLRSLADSVRLLSLPVPGAAAFDADHRRVAKALLQAARQLPVHVDLELAAEVETISLGFAVLPNTADAITRLREDHAITAAYYIGKQVSEQRIALTKAKLREQFAKERRELETTTTDKAADAGNPQAAAAVDIAEDHILVCSMTDSDMKNPKMREVVTPLKAAINVALPLMPVPRLHDVRKQLLFEFPYAADVIDFALADLVGRRTVKLRPIVIWGEPGGGKSRFAHRLAEILNVGWWQTDASRSDGAVFAGTDKRWYTAEACHPFLAIARARHANPIMLIDEIEKAGTRNDYGRFWDCLLGFLEPETAVRYPDPALQVPLDLSHVSYVATANALDPLPAPLRDRFRIVGFPKPGPEHLDALLPPVIADLAAERGLDSRWVEPLTGQERDVVATHWGGGSVRRLRRVVEVVLRAREKAAVHN